MKFNFIFGFFAVFVTSIVQAQAAQVREERQVTVSGVCKRSVIPDRGAITVASEFRDPDLKAASRKAQDAYEHTRTQIQKLGLEDLQMRTSEYSVIQVREWEKNKMVSKGFQARMGLEVTSSQVGRMGEVIALAAREGLQDVGNLRSYLSESKLLQEQTACLEEAAKNARTKAEHLASALGVKVGLVVSINENGMPNSLPPQRPMEKMMMRAEESSRSSPEIETGREDLSVTVQVVFALQ